MDKRQEFEELCRKTRHGIIGQSYKCKSGHIGCCFSCVEFMVYLYFHYLRRKDKFILSKGHACMGYYSILKEKGIMPLKVFESAGMNGGKLGKHPDKHPEWGIECSTGSLGHGLGVGCGIAYANKLDKNDNKVVVLLGDGECQEGSVWEALLFIAHHKLSNLLTVIDYNNIQAMGNTNDIISLYSLSEKLKAFNFDVCLIDGHDYDHLDRFFKAYKFDYNRETPLVLILKTIKGKGMGKFENTLESHYHVLTDETYRMCKECIDGVEK